MQGHEKFVDDTGNLLESSLQTSLAQIWIFENLGSITNPGISKDVSL